MESDQPRASAEMVEQALGAGTRQRVGWFRFFFDDQRWEWSPEVQRMHGYEPGTVTPTTELVLEHKHPDDRQQVAATLEEIRRTRKAFSTRHRIYDTAGQVRHVVMVGDQLYDDANTVVGAYGFYVDVTPAMVDEREEMVTEAVAEIAEHRAVIDQAKGMLMLVYGISDEHAFELLRWRSQDANVKLRDLAEVLVTEFIAAGWDGHPSPGRYDHILLTAHRMAKRGGSETPPQSEPAEPAT
ncbi:PAS and ANTAR domain-containing protein [Mycobacterium sp. pUA109]|uniref:PAS and ANTAR domain-containing protein n=1 Tax=Mycobacterium sp. pUA109 TaxID=3238982 RepID=UPI00351BB1B9